MKCYLLLVLAAFGGISCEKEQLLTRPDCVRVNVGLTSAVLHWNPHSSTRRLNYVILCTGSYLEKLANETLVPGADFVTRYVPMEMHNLTLYNLKPNSSYSCVVEAEGIGAGRPCYFTTHSPDTDAGRRPDKLSQFRASYNHMATSILLGGVLPMLLIGGCVVAFLLIRRVQGYKQKVEHLKKYQRLPAIGPTGGYPGSPGRGGAMSYNSPQPLLSPCQTAHQPTWRAPYYNTNPASPYRAVVPVSPYQTPPIHHAIRTTPPPLQLTPTTTPSPLSVTKPLLSPQFPSSGASHALSMPTAQPVVSLPSGLSPPEDNGSGEEF